MAAIATPTFLRSRTRILIASADASLRQRVKEDPLFAESDSEEAVGGAHALAKLLQFPCDSVLLDRNLPDLDASEVAEEIRKQFPRIDVELFDARFASVNPQDAEIREEMDSRNGELAVEFIARPVAQPIAGNDRFEPRHATGLRACAHGGAPRHRCAGHRRNGYRQRTRRRSHSSSE